ncbi:MAG: hypothetical protein AB8E87_00280 [Prochlorococcus sp.]
MSLDSSAARLISEPQNVAAETSPCSGMSLSLSQAQDVEPMPF